MDFLNKLFALILNLLGLNAAAAPASGVMAGGGTLAIDLVDLPPSRRISKIKAVIASQDLAGMSPDLIYFLADMEGGFSVGMCGGVFQKTNSLFNRHSGSGRGEWTGHVFYASAADPDIRIYKDLEQSVRDIVQLMHDRLYVHALDAARNHDVAAFMDALADAGYSAQKNYRVALQRRAESLGLV